MGEDLVRVETCRAPMKLREGNVLTGVCQSFRPQGKGVSIPGPMPFPGERLVSLVPVPFQRG